MTGAPERPRVLTDLAGEVWRIVLDRPAAGNAIDPALADGLVAALRARPDRARAVLLLGNGERFCVGGDVRAFAGSDDLPGFVGRLADAWHEAVRLLLRSPVPVVAGVQGAVAGAGVGVLGACDIVVCGRSTMIRPAYLGLGFSPDGGSSWTLARALGTARALHLTMTNGALTAAEAHAAGLVARLVEDEEVHAAALAQAQDIAAGPVRAMVRTRELVRRAAARTLDQHLDDEARLIAESAADPEGREGVRAFVERRRPDFRSDGDRPGG